jgi:hypothetical protein
MAIKSILNMFWFGGGACQVRHEKREALMGMYMYRGHVLTWHRQNVAKKRREKASKQWWDKWLQQYTEEQWNEMKLEANKQTKQNGHAGLMLM